MICIAGVGVLVLLGACGRGGSAGSPSAGSPAVAASSALAAGESIPAAPAPASTFPVTIADTVLAENVIAAIAASGGCSVSMSVGSGTLTAAYAPGNVVRMSMISDAWGSGTVTTPTIRAARYVARWRVTLDGSAWINDGTALNGRPWLRLPQAGGGSLPSITLIRTHPVVGILGLVAYAMPDAAGRVLMTSLDRQAHLVGTETLDGQPVARYTWTTGSGSGTYRHDLWVGHDWLPRKRVFSYDGLTATVRYADWGTKPTITPPADSETAVAPAGN